MQPSRKVPHVHEIVMDASRFDECTLEPRDEGVHERCQASCQHLSDDFCNSVDEANGPIIADGFGTLLLWKQDDVRGVEPMEIFRMKVGE